MYMYVNTSVTYKWDCTSKGKLTSKNKHKCKTEIKQSLDYEKNKLTMEKMVPERFILVKYIQV